jgi:hypothetical protein
MSLPVVVGTKATHNAPVSAWWLGLTDAQIEAKAAKIYADADRWDRQASNDDHLTFVATVDRNAIRTTTLVEDADRAEHAAHVDNVVCALRVTLATMDADARKTGHPSRLVEMLDALLSDVCEWSRTTQLPVMATLARALPVTRSGGPMSLQAARDRWLRFRSVVSFNHLAWSALYQVKADRTAH